MKSLLIVFLVIIFMSISNAEEENLPIDLNKSFEALEKRYKSTIKDVPFIQQTIGAIDNQHKEVTALSIKFDECISHNSTQLETIKSNIKLLGDVVESEDADVKVQRKELEKKLQQVDNQVKRCNLSKIQLSRITEELADYRLNLLKKQLLRKEVSIFSALKLLTNQGIEKAPFLPVFNTFKKLLTWEVLSTVFLALILGFFWKKKTANWEIDATNHTSPTFMMMIKGLQQTAPIILFLALIWVLVKLKTPENSALVTVVGFAFIQTFAFATLRNLIFQGVSEKAQEELPRLRIYTLFTIAIIFSTIAFALNQQSLGRFTSSGVLFYIWVASIIISAISFIFILHNSIRILLSKSSSSIYLYIPVMVIVVLIFIALLGYRNLSSLLFFGLILSVITLLFMFFLIRIGNELFDSLDQGKITWQRNIRKLMSVEENRAFPGVFWLRILSFFSIIFVSVLALISIWGGSQQPISWIQGVLKNGLKIGSLNFDVLNVIYALLIIVVTLSLIPFIKNKLIAEWLKHSNLSSGAKDATQTLVGYIVIGVALLWVLFILGMNFQNLAIVAGALSVGIGFGLQNIVNNFVSGLILLFERPIRRGDWIEVGNTEGYVRDISIRSTTIQTFDKADVIVPNSELISNQVTNWMLSSKIGRLKAAVGVAYGSDVSLLMKILNQIAEDHPEVINNQNAYPIRVLFLNFGDNSLNFELRCFVKNVNNRINIQSDVNLSIDSEFRKHNIQIPFPQRVVHMTPKDVDHQD